jgi:hypothetical protein
MAAPMLTAAAFLQQCLLVPRHSFASVLGTITAVKVCGHGFRANNRRGALCH